MGKWVMSIHEDRFGALWIGTWSEGLIRFDPESERLTRFTKDPADPDAIGSNSIYSVVESPYGDLWIATYGGGLNRIPADMVKAPHPRFMHYVNDPSGSGGISYNSIRPLYLDPAKPVVDWDTGKRCEQNISAQMFNNVYAPGRRPV